MAVLLSDILTRYLSITKLHIRQGRTVRNLNRPLLFKQICYRNNNNIEHLDTFSFLCCSVSYQYDKHITIKISTFLQTTEIIKRILKTSRKSKNTLDWKYATLWHYLLYFRDKKLASKEQDKSRKTFAEVKCVTRTAKYTWQDYKTNEDILSELKINPAVKKILNYRK
jgi:hypothetical protein